MRGFPEVEAELQRFGEFMLTKRLVRQPAAPYVVAWVRRFLARPAVNASLADQVRTFCEDLERHGAFQDWQVRQAQSLQWIPSFSGPKPRVYVKESASNQMSQRLRLRRSPSVTSSGSDRQPFTFPSLVIPQAEIPAEHPRHGRSSAAASTTDSSPSAQISRSGT